MRRVLLWTIAVFLLAAVQSLALQAHPHPPFPGFGRPPKAASSAQSEPGARDYRRQQPGLTRLFSIKAGGLGSPPIPRAANPGFDDSIGRFATRKARSPTWPNRRMTRTHPDHEDKYAWFRLHLKLAPNHGPIALLIELPVTQSTAPNLTNTGPGADVFANGKLILPEGPHPDDTFKYQQISRLYNLNIPAI